MKSHEIGISAEVTIRFDSVHGCERENNFTESNPLSTVFLVSKNLTREEKYIKTTLEGE